ncbi:dTDP-4-amino-4,6-dideoxygalactose transaminase [Myxococcus faecalis]|uniref:dTDP-4-amino-4,6-dideoxygalactose transaminase n=1 Tax=Myxococcus faecalis TaxID=3115646 RepID=UPI003CEB9C7F
MIAFTRHCPAPTESRYVSEALGSGHTEGDGPFTRRAVQLLSELTAGSHVLLTPSGTHALELAALALGVGPDDEVVMPSYTFSSTANAFALRGARLRWADVDPRTFSMEAEQLEAAWTPDTTVVVTMPYGGVCKDIDRISRMCAARGVRLVEDAAHALFANVEGRPLGSFGVLSALSFHRSKNVSCGEGGALLVRDPALAVQAEILREKGTDRSRFLRGEVDKYTWQCAGSSWLLSDILAAVLTAQLEHTPETQRHRMSLWRRYAEVLEPEGARLGLTFQQPPPGNEHPAHLFAIRLPTHVDRARLLQRMASEQVRVASHYEPLHLSPFQARMRKGAAAPVLPETESLAPRLLRLPLHGGMSLEDADHAARALVRCIEAEALQR